MAVRETAKLKNTLLLVTNKLKRSLFMFVNEFLINRVSQDERGFSRKGELFTILQAFEGYWNYTVAKSD